jgi:polyisoprenoid-binding protein YceI
MRVFTFRRVHLASWLALGLASLPAVPVAQAASYKLDGVHTSVVFGVGHLGVATTWGRFNAVSGTFSFDPESPATASFDVTVDANSIDTNSEKRDQHLRSPDFFNVKEFPTITMKSKSVKKTGDRSYEVKADLALHGVTKELTLQVKHVGSGDDPWGSYRSGFETRFKVRRSEFKMEFMPNAVGDEVELIVSIEGVRQP